MSDAAERVRVPVIDLLKAIAIVMVIWIHAFATPWDLAALPLSAILVSWAVPTFFFASGYLRQTTRPVDGATLARWLQRLLVPYAIATVLAVAYRRTVLHHRLDLGDALFALATGSAWPVYYFVPMLAGAYLLAGILSRWPRLALPLFVLVAPVVPCGLDPFPRHLGLFWLFRSPFMWWGYFLLGWLAAERESALATVPVHTRRGVGLVAAAVFVVIATVCLVPGSWRGQVWLPVVTANYAFLVSVFLLAHAAPPHRLLRWLSDASYPLYLYHFFFTSAVRSDLMRLGPLAEPAAFVAGILGSLGIVVLGRRLLGRWARLALG